MQKIYLERREVDYEFIVKIAQACMGGKSEEGTVGLDDGSMIDEMSEEQIADMRDMLGDDFDRIYGDNEPEQD
jgi:hypothetical protein